MKSHCTNLKDKVSIKIANKNIKVIYLTRFHIESQKNLD